MASSLGVVVLAAGLGKRMQSSVPKVLHEAAGQPLVHYPVQAALALGAREIVVVTSPAARAGIEALFSGRMENLSIVVQQDPGGTGEAAALGLAELESERVLILCGDTPLVRSDDLSRLLSASGAPHAPALCVITCHLDDPSGYGRILRDAEGKVLGVREDRDLDSDAARAIDEVNSGVYVGLRSALVEALSHVGPGNAQGERYLTDIVERLARDGRVVTVEGDPAALIGVNDREQLTRVEELLYARIRKQHAAAGVTVRGDARIDAGVEVGIDTVIHAGVHLRGKTRVGAGAVIDVGCIVVDSEIGDGALLKPYSVVISSHVAATAQIGPFSHLRPDSVVESEAKVGAFVETKKTRVGRGAKANHLTYLGDTDVGEKANIGAGTVICNYDGFRKHRTVIGRGAFIGSGAKLIAPVSVGDNAYVATSTTVTQNVPSEALAIGRARQTNKPDYAPKLREKLSGSKTERRD